MTNGFLRRQIDITKLTLAVTFLSTLFFYFQEFGVFISLGNERNVLGLLALLTFLLISTFILYGNFIYQLTRIGYMKRLLAHMPIPVKELNKFIYKNKAPKVCFLIPTYKEEPKLIQQTLWSAVLQDYPDKDIVLLIDNPPNPHKDHDIKLLETSRTIVPQIQSEIDLIKQNLSKDLKSLVKRKQTNNWDKAKEMTLLKETVLFLKEFIRSKVTGYKVTDHTDQFFIDQILLPWVNKLDEDYSLILENLNLSNQPKWSVLEEFYYKQIRVYKTRISSFERKIFANLSHEANKAMNLNCYLHLMGKTYVRINKSNKLFLKESSFNRKSSTYIPDAKYVVTLDADSVLLSDYTKKLVYEIEKPENHQVAVCQTPYSAFPNAKNNLEVVAGATTDIQHNIHQGFTYFNSTFWVGANAMIRKSALNDIKILQIEGEVVTPKYIQDRTVIEDTESSIDLINKGWQLFNYPEKLAYSSTPTDFGSLVIQRSRWANGGLIILPKLIRYFLRKPSIERSKECFIRANYLTSIAGVNIGTLTLLLIPFGDQIFSWWLPVASVPYYYLYAKDLKQMGYKFTDLLRVYALNLILIPINIAGVLKSLEQGITRKKIPFRRTPKVGNRTSAAMKFILSQYLLFFYTFFAFGVDITEGQIVHAAYSLLNGSLLGFAIYSFIGLKESWIDIIYQTALIKTKLLSLKD